jgi:hypothetical protein
MPVPRPTRSQHRRDGQNGAHGADWCRGLGRKSLALLYPLQDRFFTERESYSRSGEFA